MRLVFSRKVLSRPVSLANTAAPLAGSRTAKSVCSWFTPPSLVRPCSIASWRMPKAWTDDRERCRHAGIPDERAFATKPALAQQMLERTFAADVALGWVTGDSV